MLWQVTAAYASYDGFRLSGKTKILRGTSHHPNGSRRGTQNGFRN
ncbi:hypothetical protein A33Q_1014 [Indibacter alkaliphilus LW1]|uniref:Uncharacterized protein n=1 Tax=Indibacter alkaliphilus (strain CCUG 57479 / KCTC 22604 / LW1) TaxID=1189612 RepID=S2DMD0_INDAL|nr:hypothetical protein A33Q_1014 [Indibacter alkaliphilus LW1]